jgi:hypothetical protein
MVSAALVSQERAGTGEVHLLQSVLLSGKSDLRRWYLVLPYLDKFGLPPRDRICDRYISVVNRTVGGGT